MRQLNPGRIIAIATALAARSQPTFAKGTKTTSVTRQSTNGKRIFIMPND